MPCPACGSASRTTGDARRPGCATAVSGDAARAATTRSGRAAGGGYARAPRPASLAPAAAGPQNRHHEGDSERRQHPTESHVVHLLGGKRGSEKRPPSRLGLGGLGETSVQTIVTA